MNNQNKTKVRVSVVPSAGYHENKDERYTAEVIQSKLTQRLDPSNLSPEGLESGVNMNVDIEIKGVKDNDIEISWCTTLKKNGHVNTRSKEKTYHSNNNHTEDDKFNLINSIANVIVSDVTESVKTDCRKIIAIETDVSYEELKWTEAPLDNTIVEEKMKDPEDFNSSTSSKKLRMPIYAEKTALLVVDVQPEYWSQCPAVRKDFPNLPQNLKRTISTCRERGSKIIFVRADYRHSHSPWLAQFARLRGQSPDTMTEIYSDADAGGFEWEDFASPLGGDIILPKTSWSSTSNSKLMTWLRSSGIDTVLVCGLITSVCVQHSAFSIFEAGFRTLLVTDASGDRGQARHDAALALYGDYMYELVTSYDLANPENGIVKAAPILFSLQDTKLQPKEFSVLQSSVTSFQLNTI
jgi:maleamate amidohydrolase